MAKAAKTAVKTKAAPKPAAKKAGATAKAAVNTVTLRHLGVALSETHELPKKQANAVLEDMVALITKHLKKGDRIRIGGLGILQVRKRPARMGRHPRTGEPLPIPARRAPRITAGTGLKRAVADS